MKLFIGEEEVKIGVQAKTFKGEDCTVVGMREPHKPGSTGRVIVKLNGNEREFFPGVIGAEWKGEE